MGGATSIVGSGGQPGLLRNLDKAANDGGPRRRRRSTSTRSRSTTRAARARTGDCNYGGTRDDARRRSRAIDAYEPHTSEGIDATAHNEFLCESSTTLRHDGAGRLERSRDREDRDDPRVGLSRADYALMARDRHRPHLVAALEHHALRRHRARHEAARLGVNIALGTDWMPTGSMNMLRELACADSFNTDVPRQASSPTSSCGQMVTSNAARGHRRSTTRSARSRWASVADIAIFDGHGKDRTAR